MNTTEEQQLVDVEERDVNTILQRRGRGHIIGISIKKKRCVVGHLDVIIHPHRNQIMRNNVKDFKIEAMHF